MALDMALYIKSLIEEAGIHKLQDNFDCEKFCEKLDMEPDKVIKALLILFIKEQKKVMPLKREILELVRENDMLNNILDDVFHGNGRLKQMAEVSKGLPIAKKKKKDLLGVDVSMRMGLTDKEIMEKHNISRATLWRWKKEITEERKRLEEVLSSGSKQYRR